MGSIHIKLAFFDSYRVVFVVVSVAFYFQHGVRTFTNIQEIRSYIYCLIGSINAKPHILLLLCLGRVICCSLFRNPVKLKYLFLKLFQFLSSFNVVFHRMSIGCMLDWLSHIYTQDEKKVHQI